MLYSVIGLMSGSSLDGLDIVFAHLHAEGGRWTYQIRQADCYPYAPEWTERLQTASALSASDYLALHAAYGHYLGEQVNRFIREHDLQFQVQLICSHGHTVFHFPSRRMTGQLGDGAAIAAETGIHTITDLRAMDIALGGQGAPIVPIGERLLLGHYPFFLNLGGIANVSAHMPQRSEGAGQKGRQEFIAFDICPANRVLNLIAGEKGLAYDHDGNLAASGSVNEPLMRALNALDYYTKPYPKSLDNSFGVSEVYPLLRQSSDTVENRMRTYTEHICIQTANALTALSGEMPDAGRPLEILVCGGGAHNKFLIGRLQDRLKSEGIGLVLPDHLLIDYKEALIMALIGVLRWREETNVMASVTGAIRDSIGGAIWMGQEK